jgi:hypothetical protein
MHFRIYAGLSAGSGLFDVRVVMDVTISFAQIDDWRYVMRSFYMASLLVTAVTLLMIGFPELSFAQCQGKCP